MGFEEEALGPLVWSKIALLQESSPAEDVKAYWLNQSLVLSDASIFGAIFRSQMLKIARVWEIVEQTQGVEKWAENVMFRMC